ncbi:hypothetical protein A1D23_12405 [Chelonobacter oris]|nr:hypothetical protein [Chelonobacter oris]
MIVRFLNKIFDTVYIKIKHAFAFKTRTEELQGIKGLNRKFAEAALDDRAYAHDITPGVYYHLADDYSYGHLNITLVGTT